MPLEVDLETMRERIPAHQENKLLDHGGAFSVGHTIDEGLSSVS